MGVAVIPKRLCAINPDHGEATLPTVIDGREYRVCSACGVMKPPPEECDEDEHVDSLGRRSRAAKLRRAIVRAVEHNPRATTAEISDVLGVEERVGRKDRGERDKVYQLMKRLVVEGYLCSERQRGVVVYWVPDAKQEAA